MGKWWKTYPFPGGNYPLEHYLELVEWIARDLQQRQHEYNHGARAADPGGVCH